jgi:hypothetical protein
VSDSGSKVYPLLYHLANVISPIVWRKCAAMLERYIHLFRCINHVPRGAQFRN